MAARTVGRLGRGGGPAPALLSPPLRRCEAAGLEEGVGEHRHERMAVQAGPGPALEGVAAGFLLQLLVGLLARPARLDGGDRESVVEGKRGDPGGRRILKKKKQVRILHW